MILKNKKQYFKIPLISLIIFVLLSLLSLEVKADNYTPSRTGKGQVIVITALGFDDHNGMMSKIGGEYVYCIQRGYTFRTKVSELQMVTMGVGSTDTIASHLRDILANKNEETGVIETFFRCWGQAEYNDDHTNLIPTTSDYAPTSYAWQEAFDEDGEDTEDPDYESKYEGDSTRTTSYFSIWKKLTGHEESLDTYQTEMKEIKYNEAGLDESQYYAFGITQYYCWEDPDSASFSDDARYQVKQALDWATEFGFITTIGDTGYNLTLIYQDSTGKYGRSGSQSYTGSCDGYIKTTIGGQYEAMKLYRQVVWKTTNMRTIPSFASDKVSTAPTIQLYWDDKNEIYTTTISDSNGVLKYFDFQIDGVTCTDNGNGTLTITSKNEIDGELINTPIASKIEPENGYFKLPTFYRWVLEGTPVTFKYAAVKRDLAQETGGEYYIPSNGTGRTTIYGLIYNHSHDYVVPCNWFCDRDETEITHCRYEDDDYPGYYNVKNHNNIWNVKNHTSIINSCTKTKNAGKKYYGHNDNCDKDDNGNYTCTTDHGWYYSEHKHTSACHTCNTTDCHTHTKADCHDCDTFEPCQHKSTCPYWIHYEETEYMYCDDQPNTDEKDYCTVVWCCEKYHVEMVDMEITGTYIDWQDHEGVYAKGDEIIDPTYAYIKVTTVKHDFPAQTDTDILLVAENSEWNNLVYESPSGEKIEYADHIRVGERYKLIYIYSYKGSSKGFYITSSDLQKPYYQYNYLSRMQAPNNTTKIYDLRGSATTSTYSVPHAVLEIKKTPIKIYGSYTTGETPYIDDTYSWNSGSSWNDSIYLDALTYDQIDDNYDNKSADGFENMTSGDKGDYEGRGETITSSNASARSFEVSKINNEIQVVWTFETDYEIFSSAVVNATSLIEVGEDKNYTKSYYDEAYNYANDQEWDYSLEDHNNVGGRGYFSSEYLENPYGEQSDTSINAHIIYTQNNEYLTYAVANKVYQSNVDIYATNVVVNTGAGITEHTYYERAINVHPLNFNLYYTIVMENPEAYIYDYKLKVHDKNIRETSSDTNEYDTSGDEYEFDVNTYITWETSGSLEKDDANSGHAILVDHIRGGEGRNYTYIQREIPVVLGTLTTGKSALMGVTVNPNYDKLIYEDEYKGASTTETSQTTTTSISLDTAKYNNNMSSATSKIYAAMDPTNKLMQPKNITASANVPNNANDEVRSYMAGSSNASTSFTIYLSGSTKSTKITDSNLKDYTSLKDGTKKNAGKGYTQYDFKFNTDNAGNKVTFPSYRTSITFFKYSKTSYEGVATATGTFNESLKTQRESYYFSQILFKSNYTTKYQKELEEKGANYIIEKNSDGSTNAWIDMVNQNEYAIVAAGQGFELKVTVKYENTFLTQYLARYKGYDDAQSYSIGTSTNIGAQYCNISSMTGFITNDGKSHSYINGISTIDRLASQLVTGSNVYKDLYCYMSDNPDVVYSYSGIYDTPVIFDRSISYSKDYSVTTITYTMCKSAENGVASTMQNMKFYTNQLAPDSETPGVVYNGNLPSGKHSITLWTPIVAATGFDYPESIEDRYIGDAIEIGYTIKTTAADDSIVHIVQ